MASSNCQLFDPVRKTWVKETAEELIRQKILQIMVRDLHFPPSMLAIEKELSLLPHLQLTPDVPKRRLDILAFAKNGEELFPLLLIECKAVKLTPQFAQLHLIQNNHSFLVLGLIFFLSLY